MSENKENKNGTGCGCLVLIIIAFTFWGLTSMANGIGFFNGIAEQIYAAFLLGVIALFIYILYKLFWEK
jgi:hypothetical protein